MRRDEERCWSRVPCEAEVHVEANTPWVSRSVDVTNTCQPDGRTARDEAGGLLHHVQLEDEAVPLKTQPSHSEGAYLPLPRRSRLTGSGHHSPKSASRLDAPRRAALLGHDIGGPRRAELLVSQADVDKTFALADVVVPGTGLGRARGSCRPAGCPARARSGQSPTEQPRPAIGPHRRRTAARQGVKDYRSNRSANLTKVQHPIKGTHDGKGDEDTGRPETPSPATEPRVLQYMREVK